MAPTPDKFRQIARGKGRRNKNSFFSTFEPGMLLKTQDEQKQELDYPTIVMKTNGLQGRAASFSYGYENKMLGDKLLGCGRASCR